MKKYQKHIIALILCLAFILSLTAFTCPVNATSETTDVSARVDSLNQRIVVKATESELVNPDFASVTLSVIEQAPTATEAADLVSASMEKVFAAIEAQGISSDDFFTSSFSIWPRTSWKYETPKVYAYEVNNQITILVRDVEKVGEVIATALDAGANNVQNVTYGLDDSTESYNKAMVRAMGKAQTKAFLLAESCGLAISPAPIYIKEGSASIYPNDYPVYKAMETQAAAESATSAPPLAAQQIEVVAYVEAIYMTDLPENQDSLNQNYQQICADEGIQINVSASQGDSLQAEFAQITLSVVRQGVTATEATELNSEAMKEVFAVLKDMGISSNDFYTSNFNVFSLTNYDADPPQIYAYEASNEIRVSLKDPSVVGEVIVAALDAGANQIYQIAYDINDSTDKYNEILQEAVVIAAEKAELLATAVGLESSGPPSFLAEGRRSSYQMFAEYAYDQGMMYGYGGMGAAGGGMPISSQLVEVAADVEAIYLAK